MLLFLFKLVQLVYDKLTNQKSSDAKTEQPASITDSTEIVSPSEDFSESTSLPKTLKEKNTGNQDDSYFKKEAQCLIEKKLDSMFKPWWNWYYEWEKTIPDKSLSPSELTDAGGEMQFREPLKSGFYKKEEVVASVIKKIPQCEKMEVQLNSYYEEEFLERQNKILDTIRTTLEKKSIRKFNKDF